MNKIHRYSIAAIPVLIAPVPPLLVLLALGMISMGFGFGLEGLAMLAAILGILYLGILIAGCVVFSIAIRKRIKLTPASCAALGACSGMLLAIVAFLPTGHLVGLFGASPLFAAFGCLAGVSFSMLINHLGPKLREISQ